MDSMFEKMGEGTDDRNFKEQMADIGVEVLSMPAMDQEDKPKDKPKDKPAVDTVIKLDRVGRYHDIDSYSDDKIKELIEADGARVSVQLVRSIPREKLEKMCMDKEPVRSMAEELGISPAVTYALRGFYRLRSEDLGHRKPPKKSEPKPEDNKMQVKSAENKGSDNKMQVKNNGREPISTKTINAPGNVAALEVIGTAKALNQLGEEEVTVEITVRRLKQ